MTDTDTQSKKLRTFQRDVLITLTPEERHKRGAMLADKLREASELREDFKKVQREWSSRLKDADKEIERIADAVRDGKENRQTLCYEIIIGGSVETRRVDTDEQVAAPRPATMQEAQEPLRGVPPGQGILDGGNTQVDESGDVVVGDFAAPRGKKGKH